jgi:cell division protein FtsQ
VARDAKKTQAAKPTTASRLKRVLGWAAALVFLATCGVAASKARDHILADPAYTLSRDNKIALTFQGMNYSSRTRVLRVFDDDFGHSIFSIPVDARRRRLLAIDWVEDASVARVWPDRLLVRLRERRPVAFVFFRSGVALIDREGVLLDAPPTAQFSFPVLAGVREDETEAQRAKHVRCMLAMQEDMGYLAKDISEVNAADAENIRVVAKVGDRPVELMLGDANFAARYQNFLNNYPEIHKRSPGAKVFDLRMDDRITTKE